MTSPDSRAQEASELETRALIRTEGERLRDHMTMLMERQGRKIQGLIDAIELMNYIDSEARQHGTAPDD